MYYYTKLIVALHISGEKYWDGAWEAIHWLARENEHGMKPKVRKNEADGKESGKSIMFTRSCWLPEEYNLWFLNLLFPVNGVLYQYSSVPGFLRNKSVLLAVTPLPCCAAQVADLCVVIKNFQPWRWPSYVSIQFPSGASGLNVLFLQFRSLY